MNVINLLGGPGVGKSTTAAYLYYRFKLAGFRTELVGEAAREIIYNSDPGVTAPQLIDNQLLVSGMQYERLLRLKRHKVEVAISDSPLIQGALYAPEEKRNELLLTLETLSRDFDNTYVFIEREAGNYDQESRAQTEAEALTLDQKAMVLHGRHCESRPLIMKWGEERKLADLLIDVQKLNRARLAVEEANRQERYKQRSWRD